jgi:hypothetical protein
MGFVVDQQPVRALRPHGPYPALGITVRPRCPRRGLHDPYALAGQDIVEALAPARGGVTTDDTTLFLVEWRGGSLGDLVTMDA